MRSVTLQNGGIRTVALVLLIGALSFGPGSRASLGSPQLTGLSVSNGTARYAGDGSLLTTVSPNGDGYRDRALIRFHLSERATVEIAIAATGVQARNVFHRFLRLGGGAQVIAWRPPAQTAPRTYLVRLRFPGRDWPHGYPGAESARPPVIRVLGIEAAFTSESYAPEHAATLRLASDEPLLTLQVLHVASAGRGDKDVDAAVAGTPVGQAVTIVQHDRDTPRSLRIWVGDWDSGLYAVRLTAEDGRVGYAPFVVRARRLGEHAAAIVLPTFTWQAYNFRDLNGDGYGDTWYVRGREVRMARPGGGRGLPSHFRAYDLGFLIWLARGEAAGKARRADFLADSDLARIPAAALTRAYDLIVFPGHHEYVTTSEYDHVRTFKSRGGNLMFLSANNFYWRVVRRGRMLTRVVKWRDAGRPEAGLIGVQYVASDRGQHQGPYVVRDVSRAPWLFDGTGLLTGSRFGSFGIEIDARARRSPRQTLVLAEIPHVMAGKTAQMTYYETHQGAKVFAAGAFTLAGAATQPVVARLLDNLWDHLAKP